MKEKKSQSKKVVVIAFLANLFVALVKFIIAFITKSSSLFSEAIHSLADTSNQLLLLVGIRSRNKKEDERHPFGYGQEEFFWAFVVAIQIFLLGGIFSIYEAVKKLEHPEKMEKIYLGILIIFISLGAEFISFFKAKRSIKKLLKNRKKSIFKFLKESSNVELIVVYLEDLAAIIGLTIAFIAILLSYTFKNPVYDILGSFLIGAVLITVSIILGKEMKSLIIDEAPPLEFTNEVKQFLLEIPEVKKVISIKPIILGVNTIFMAIKLHLDENIPSDKIPKKIKSIEDKVKNHFKEVKYIFIEPN